MVRDNLKEMVVATFVMGMLAAGKEGAAVVCVAWVVALVAKWLWELACWWSTWV